jgi:hypothetical protein
LAGVSVYHSLPLFSPETQNTLVPGTRLLEQPKIAVQTNKCQAKLQVRAIDGLWVGRVDVPNVQGVLAIVSLGD